MIKVDEASDVRGEAALRSVSLAVVLGSATQPGRLHRAVMRFTELATELGAVTTVLDLSQHDLPPAGTIAAEHCPPAVVTALNAVVEATAVVVVSPVYRATYTGVLKNLIDLLPTEALRSKPVGIVAMGGSHHHYLGIDNDLRSVLAWFGAVAAPTSVYLTGADFDAIGELKVEATQELRELAETVVGLAVRLDGVEFGPAPLSARAW